MAPRATRPTAQPAGTQEQLVQVRLAHFKDHDGKAYKPGDVLEVPAATARSWIWGGYANAVPAEPAAAAGEQ